MWKSLTNCLVRGLSAAAITAVMISPAMAMSANEARQAGLIVEDCQGYVKAKSAEGQAIAASINAERKAEYERIAKRDKLDVKTVAATAGAKLCQKYPPK